MFHTFSAKLDRKVTFGGIWLGEKKIENTLGEID